METEQLTKNNIYTVEHNYILISTASELNNLISYLQGYKQICFDTETTGLNPHEAEIVGVSFCVKQKEAFYIDVWNSRENLYQVLKKFFEAGLENNILWIGQNVKYDYLILKNNNLNITGRYFDTMLAQYLIDPEERKGMDYMSEKYLNYEPIHIQELIGEKKRGNKQKQIFEADINLLKDYAAEDADITFQLSKKLVKSLSTGGRNVLKIIEFPLLPVIAEIELNGVKVDTNFLKEYEQELIKEKEDIIKYIYDVAGEEFNISSPKQLGEILFEKLKIKPAPKLTKSGQYSTGVEVLEKLKGNDVVNKILEYRQIEKLITTYVSVIPDMVNDRTGLLHTTLNQARTSTGRLSCSDPNLQQIPIRTARGKKIRKAFISRFEGGKIISVDYSQIELRILASFSGDKALIDAYKTDKDIHIATAAIVFNKKEEEVTKELRSYAKTINFGIIYGQSAFALAQQLGIKKWEAEKIIKDYKTSFKGINTYIEEKVSDARRNGYVETLLGRRRYVPDICSTDKYLRAFAERTAVNMPIQGTSADLIKLAMIKVQKFLTENKLRSKLILQVHDELVFDAHPEEVDFIIPNIKYCMETALCLPHAVIPKAEVGIGENWLEAH